MAWMARPDGWIYWYNRRWYEYTGVEPGDAQGRGWEQVQDPALLPELNARWRHAIATGEPLEISAPTRRADGVYRQFLVRAAPLRDSDGHIIHWFGTCTDFHAHSEAEMAL